MFNWSSSSCNVILVGRISTSPIFFFIMDSGMRLMLAPRSNKAFPNFNYPIGTYSVKLPKLVILYGRGFWIIALHTTSNSTISSFKILIFLVNNSFMNFAYVGICSIAFVKGMLIYKFFIISKYLLNNLSLSFLVGTCGYILNISLFLFF